MNKFKALNFDTKFIAFFAVSSLLIVILTGTIAGIEISLILVRAFISVVAFSFLAYGIILVLKNLLPEVYLALNKTSSDEEIDGNVDIPGKASEGFDGDDVGKESEGSLGETATGIDEFDKSASGELSDSGINDEAIQPDMGSGKRKMGKHLLKFEGIDKYEPKIMAEAIRTMMSKDED